MQNQSYRHRGLHDHDTGYSSRILTSLPISLCKVSSAPRLLAACCTWSTRKSSLGFFQVMGQVLAVQVWPSWWASLCRYPTSKGNPSTCWPVTLMFYVVSLHVLRNNRRVGNLAAVRLLWSIIFQRRVEHSCGQTSRRNTCYTTAILLCLVSFDHTFGQWIRY